MCRLVFTGLSFAGRRTIASIAAWLRLGRKRHFTSIILCPRLPEGQRWPAISGWPVFLRKEARRSAVDPDTGRRVPLFHPRRQRWSDHFRWEGFTIVGLTPTGRATVVRFR